VSNTGEDKGGQLVVVAVVAVDGIDDGSSNEVVDVTVTVTVVVIIVVVVVTVVLTVDVGGDSGCCTWLL